MLLERMQIFVRKSLFYPEVNFRSLERIVCSNLRQFCTENNQQTEIDNKNNEQQNQQASESPNIETKTEESTSEISNEQPQISTSQESTPPIDDSQQQLQDNQNQQQQQQQQIQDQSEKQQQNNNIQSQKQSPGRQNRQQQRQVRSRYGDNQYQYQQQYYQQGNRDGNKQYLNVLRIEGTTQYALRQDLQELFSAFGADVSEENIVPEFQSHSFGVRRWWALVNQEQKDILLKAKSGDHFRLSERRVSIFSDQMARFNQQTFNTMGLSQSMGRYVVIHDLPASSHEADVLRIFRNYSIAPNGVQVMQMDHRTRSTDHNPGKKALIKFVDDLEANRAARIMHGKLVKGNYKIKLTVLP